MIITNCDSTGDSDKHWPFLLEFASTLYGNVQFAIISARSLTFLGAFQFLNSRNVQENVM